ncbi:hypothetical protein AGMMS49525_17400 [Bacteroidia bacterium]|nr:hypothetical protein AGMMS49525_17400 [Bacteroidia bacterium]
MKKNFVKEIKQTIEEVNYEIMVELGLIEPVVEVEEAVEPNSDSADELAPEEWPEVIAFEKLLDEIAPDSSDFNTVLTELEDDEDDFAILICSEKGCHYI